MEKFKHLLIDFVDKVSVLQLNRPEVLNAFNREMIAELSQAVEHARKDENVKAIVVTGAGDRAFSVGADLKGGVFSPDMSPQEAVRMAKLGQNLMSKVNRCEKPIIAAVNGLALGGGCELAIACDLIVASENAEFGQPEVNLGLVPAWGGSARLPRLIGVLNAKGLILLGKRITVDQAQKLGLVYSVVSRESLKDTAVGLANELAYKNPTAVRLAKALVNRCMGKEMDELLAAEVEGIKVCFSNGDAKEGLRAFMEKRKPVFKTS